MSPNNKSNRKSNKTPFLVIGIIAIILAAVLIGVGAFIVLGHGSANNSPTPTPTPAPTTFNGTPTPSPSTSTSPTSETDPLYVGGTKVLLQTSIGNITLELRNDKPITTANFINIVNHGWYDTTPFHRVVAGFMIQAGGISQTVPAIADEIGSSNHNTIYTITMAKTSQPNSATSEFFINVADNSHITYQDGTTFDGTYSVFGKVIDGQSVVNAIANAPVTTNAYGENSQPLSPVTITKATVIS
jgi:cyclophilin family peptidyl-prolyl cis-trans isomerase